MASSIHKTVLLNEAIDGLLAPHKAGNESLVVLDGTFGAGGHSLEICKRFSKGQSSVKIIALDQDQNALERAGERFTGCNISLINENFRNLDRALEGQKVEKVDGIIFDLGLSSDQLEGSGRGFSFIKSEPLLMTMKENPSPEDITAYDVVNDWEEGHLADIIRGFGEERYSRRIAKKIAEVRKGKKIKTSMELSEVIREAVPAGYRRGKIHYATRTFQAIRIAVNDELGALSEGLEKGWKALGEGGRMAVISFHSLEDRIVKRFYKKQEQEGKGILINKKVITAGVDEIKSNPRSRSAKLRIIEKL